MSWLQRSAASALADGLGLLGQSASANGLLPSEVFVFENLPVHHTDKLDERAIVGGKTIDGCTFSVHESALQPNNEPHPPHHHKGEEMFLLLDGTLRVTINGVSTEVTKGGVAFIGSGDEHGIFNPGPALAKYYVVEFGPQK